MSLLHHSCPLRYLNWNCTSYILVTCMGFGSQEVWGIGFCGCMGYWPGFPAYQVGHKKNLWDIREYGLPEPWVKRESTVVTSVTNTVGQSGCFFLHQMLRHWEANTYGIHTSTRRNSCDSFCPSWTVVKRNVQRLGIDLWPHWLELSRWIGCWYLEVTCRWNSSLIDRAFPLHDLDKAFQSVKLQRYNYGPYLCLALFLLHLPFLHQYRQLGLQVVAFSSLRFTVH